MKFSIVAAVATFAAVAQAQDACLTAAAAIPACALGYLASAASSIGNCGLVDFQCQCSNSASVQGAIAGTVAQQCSGSINDVIQSAGALCSCASANAGQSVSLDAVASQCIGSAAAIPPCALGYLASAANSIGGCAIDDFACQCSNSAAVQGAIAGTVAQQCSGGVNDVIQSAGALCSCVAGAGGSGGSSGGSSMAMTTGGSSMAMGSSMAGSSMKGSSMPSATAKASGSMGSGSLPSSAFTGGAATGGAAIGGIMGAMMGLIAYL